MKKGIYLIAILITCTFSACAGNKEEPAIDSNQNSNSNLPSPIDMKKIASISEDDISNYEEMGFDAIALQEESTFGNLPINNKAHSFVSVFCPDRNTGDIYYSNYNDNHYLYRYADGKQELLVEKRCNFINLVGDSIYFINYENELGYPEASGSIYRYDLDTKECSMIIDKNAISLSIQNGILFFLVNETVEYIENGVSILVKPYYAELDNPIAEPFSGAQYIPYKDWFFTKQGLVNYHTKQIVPNRLESNEKFGRSVCIYQDTLFNQYPYDVLEILNLKNGEYRKYTAADFGRMYKEYCEQEKVPYDAMMTFYSITAYTVIGDDLYLAFDGNPIFMKMNMTSTACEYYYIYHEEEKTYTTALHLFTDGKELYAVIDNGTGTGALLGKLVLTDFISNVLYFKDITELE